MEREISGGKKDKRIQSEIEGEYGNETATNFKNCNNDYRTGNHSVNSHLFELPGPEPGIYNSLQCKVSCQISAE